MIDSCDYYVLILGGRYGSTDADRLSFTEKEFDYATSKKVPVFSLVHGDLEAISLGQTDSKPAIRKKLAKFRNKVQAQRMCKMWRDTARTRERTSFLFPTVSGDDAERGMGPG